MGLWGRIKKGVKKVADAVEAFVNDVGDAVGNAVEAVGDAVNDALDWLGGKVGAKPVFAWLGGVIKGAFSVVGAVVKGAFGIVGGIVGGLIKIAGGVFTLQGPLILQGLWDVFSPIIGAVIVVGGKLVAWIQSIFYAQAFERRLTEWEEAQLKRAFRDALNYYVIRIIEGHAGAFGLNTRPFTLGNTIYMKRSSFPMDLLVHETTHVWQYQKTGDRYASDALTAQWFVEDPYNWQREVNVRNKSDWSEFNSEAQAEFLEDLWKHGELRDQAGTTMQTGNGAFFEADGKAQLGQFGMSGRDYTTIAREAVTTVRRGWFS